MTELANLPLGAAAAAHFQSRYPDLFASSGAAELARHWAVHDLQEDYEPETSEGEFLRKYWLLPLQGMLREIWDCEDPRTRLWGVFQIRQQLLAQWEPRFDATPFASFPNFSMPDKLAPPSEFEESLVFLAESVHLARHCANKDCPSPYFFAKRRTQKYCDSDCALPAQRAFKQDWWAKHGKEWRGARGDKR